MSINNCIFEEYVKAAGIEFIHDNIANTLIIEDVGNTDLNSFVPLVKEYAFQRKIAKISIKVKESSAVYFFQHGFKVEASIMAYYGLQDAFYIVYYLKDSYLENQFEEKHDAILDASFVNNDEHQINLDNSDITISSGSIEPLIADKKQLVYSGRKIPTPNSNESNQFYAQINNEIAATVNAYHCKKRNVVEFSNFTVNAELETNDVITHLLTEMENHYASINCKTAYTTVPASSLMINTRCAVNDFEFGGRLMNESFFKGKLDSLNAWSKQL
ncbi:hypothetical protein [Pseudocolwellia agarivorans]|mgnify:CR=1 FL=1|uniref:hypothetical protein n=1 Tax=Pseudocolwellia agarivorans TaxID=1911682 RepID=UPI0009857A98|nr:hypothetical protein [Pseudocolwellia agarivorans]